MPLPYTFGGLSSWNASWLDDDFAALAAQTTIACSIAGANALILTPLPNAPLVSTYQIYQRFGGIAAAPNTGATTANVAGLGVLPVYKDTGAGPAALSGGEIETGNYIVLVYDLTLNSGAGGFHLQTAASTSAGTITAVVAGTGLTGGGSSGSVTVSFGSIADKRVLANISGGSAAPIANTLTAILDSILGSTQGSIVYRGASAWAVLGPGTQGQYLYSGGAGANPSWQGGIAINLSAAGTTQGTATQLAARYNQVATTGSGTGVILATVLGVEQWIWNDGANTLNVYPPSGAQIDNAGTNAAVTLTTGTKAGYVMISSTQAKSLP